MDETLPYCLPETSAARSREPGRKRRDAIFPTVNRYLGEDGGYIALYSRDKKHSVYSVGGGIYVIGRIRLKGRYIGRIFHPEGYENEDISAAQEFKDMCLEVFGLEGWAGGDTGGWFGLG